MMTATQVFGYRAGKAAALRARSTRHIPAPPPAPAIQAYRSGRSAVHEIEGVIPWARQRMMRHLGVLRDAAGLAGFRKEACRAEKALLETGWSSAADLTSFVQARTLLRLAQMICQGALARDGSLGPHYRMDQDTASSV